MLFRSFVRSLNTWISATYLWTATHRHTGADKQRQTEISPRHAEAPPAGTSEKKQERNDLSECHIGLGKDKLLPPLLVASLGFFCSHSFLLSFLPFFFFYFFFFFISPVLYYSAFWRWFLCRLCKCRAWSRWLAFSFSLPFRWRCRVVECLVRANELAAERFLALFLVPVLAVSALLFFFSTARDGTHPMGASTWSPSFFFLLGTSVMFSSCKVSFDGYLSLSLSCLVGSACLTMYRMHLEPHLSLSFAMWREQPPISPPATGAVILNESYRHCSILSLINVNFNWHYRLKGSDCCCVYFWL